MGWNLAAGYFPFIGLDISNAINFIPFALTHDKRNICNTPFSFSQCFAQHFNFQSVFRNKNKLL